MKVSRQKLRKLIMESYRRGGYVHPNDPKHQRNREAYDGDGPGDPSMRGVYGDPNEKLRGATIEYPRGKKAFLQSMIDTYRKVGMHEEADEAQAELDAMTDDIFKATLNEAAGTRYHPHISTILKHIDDLGADPSDDMIAEALIAGLEDAIELVRREPEGAYRLVVALGDTLGYDPLKK